MLSHLLHRSGIDSVVVDIRTHDEIATTVRAGFALLSRRTPDVQRVCLQCATGDAAEQWSDDRIWSEIAKRVNGNGFEVQQGPISDKTLLPLPSAHPWSKVLFEMSTIRTAFVVVVVVGATALVVKAPR